MFPASLVLSEGDASATDTDVEMLPLREEFALPTNRIVGGSKVALDKR